MHVAILDFVWHIVAGPATADSSWPARPVSNRDLGLLHCHDYLENFGPNVSALNVLVIRMATVVSI